jgi:arylsulfatase A-like enzyme
MCDAYLGKVLDAMDRYDLWKDTMLIVNTDHGFLLGEHGWWGKMVMPVYNEIAHTPLFVWDPRTNQKGISRNSLVQTIDLAPTLLEYFNQPIPESMEGKSLKQIIQNDEPIRDYALFGLHGGHINITDGRYVYMHAPVTFDNRPLYDYTLMPTHMRNMFTVEELKTAELVEPFGFTKGCPVLKIKGDNTGTVNPFQYGSKLFDLSSDPEQTSEIEDDAVILRLLRAIRDDMKKKEAPAEQYERLGIPMDKDFGPELLADQRTKAAASLRIEILEDREWDRGARNAFIALRNMGRFPPAILHSGFEAYILSHGEKRVTTELLRAYMSEVLSGETAAMVGYFIGLLGRTG